MEKPDTPPPQIPHNSLSCLPETQNSTKISKKYTKHALFSGYMSFFQKKKPLREAAQRIRGFYPEKKAPAGGRTTDMGFLYIKSKIPRSKIQKSKNPKKYKILKSKIQHQKWKIHHETQNIQYPKSKIEKKSKCSKISKKENVLNFKIQYS